jgi:hypothetical protein
MKKKSKLTKKLASMGVTDVYVHQNWSDYVSELGLNSKDVSLYTSGEHLGSYMQ